MLLSALLLQCGFVSFTYDDMSELLDRLIGIVDSLDVRAWICLHLRVLSLHTAIVPVVLLIFGLPAPSRFSSVSSVLSPAQLLMVSLKYATAIAALFWAGAVSFGFSHVLLPFC